MTDGADFSAQGLLVGHATDSAGGTGLTVIRGASSAFRGSAAVVGRAAGTRQFDALSPDHVVDRIDAILLSGGSAFGLDAAAGVMRWMAERGRGFKVRDIVVPIVPTAVLFDLGPLGRTDARPTSDMAFHACESAAAAGFAEGSVGAGTGATVGKVAGIERCMKGGLGAATASAATMQVSAIAVVNAFGNVLDSRGAVLAGARESSGVFVDASRAVADGIVRSSFRAGRGSNTTLALVACSAQLSRIELRQLAVSASAAFFRRISPAGTTVDGDVVFAVCPLSGEAGDIMAAESLAVSALEMAIERAVLLASGTDAVPSISDLAQTKK